MTITEKELTRYGESMRIFISEAQKVTILERFGAEPEPYEWSEQDIAVQIRNFLDCGEFVKSMRNNNGGHSTLSSWVDF